MRTTLITKFLILFFSFFIIIIFSSNISPKITDYPGRDHNICKKLKGNILLYVIWAETKESYQWTDYDINSTIDSIRFCIKWLENEAKKDNINLKINFDYFQNDTLKSIYQRLSGSFRSLIRKPEGREQIDKWCNKVVKIVSGFNNKEDFIAYLRNENNIETVALLFMVNNFFKPDFACSFNTTSDEKIEYSIISTKRTNLIIQEILHLFGAPYLYIHPSITPNRKTIRQLKEAFPTDIMNSTDKNNISELSIGEITKYYIGWTDTIKLEYDKLVKENKIKI